MTSTVPRVSSNDGDVVRFPFSAVVGHDDLRLALLLNAVHPGVGGVLVRGEKGTAKSTAVRALAALLPAVAVVPDCRFSCDPAAPDPRCPDGPHPRTAGRLRRPGRLRGAPARGAGVAAAPGRARPPRAARRAARRCHGGPARRVAGPGAGAGRGVRAYQPGLLAEAHRGVLYVDEVNLLHDHLVDLLLDAAAMGRAHVERDGVSVSHAASFLLVGTMNPEEGELRPQLLDRFGLTVEVRASRDVETRVEVVRRRMAFEADPAAFAATFAEAEGDTARPHRGRAGPAGVGGAARRRAAPDRRGLRGVRRRRHARGPGHRPRGGGARGVARGGRRGEGGRAGGGPAGAAAPAPPRPVRRAGDGRAGPRRGPGRDAEPEPDPDGPDPGRPGSRRPGRRPGGAPEPGCRRRSRRSERGVG